MAQRLMHLPAMQETWVQSLGQEGPLAKEMATHSSIVAWKIPWTEEPGRSGVTKSRTHQSDFTFTFIGFRIRKIFVSIYSLPVNSYG